MATAPFSLINVISLNICMYRYILDSLFQKSLTSLFGSQQPSKNMSNTVEEATFDIEPYKLHLLEEGPPQV